MGHVTRAAHVDLPGPAPAELTDDAIQALLSASGGMKLETARLLVDALTDGGRDDGHPPARVVQPRRRGR